MRYISIIKIYFIIQVFLAIFVTSTIFRSLGIADFTKVILATNLVLDLSIVLLGLQSLKKLKTPFSLILLIVYINTVSLILGIANYGLTQAILKELIIYNTFFLKIIIFYNVFQIREYRYEFLKFAVRHSIVAVAAGAIAIVALQILSYIGYKFYFASTPNITYALTMSMASGSAFYTYFVMLEALLTGKRMIFFGALVIFILGYRQFLNTKKNNLFFILVVIPLISYIFFYYSDFLSGVAKLVKTFDWEFITENSVAAIAQQVDRARYGEFVGIIKAMDIQDYILGKGFGFRFFWDGFEEARFMGRDHSNAHFTPIGILSKFGVLGTLLFLSLFVGTLIRAYRQRQRDKLDYMNFLFLMGIYTQSLFAYILFNNPLIPIIMGLILSSKIYHESIHRVRLPRK